MSLAQTYSCTMPERRSKDHIHRLWFAIAAFTVAGLVWTVSMILTLPYPILAYVNGALATLSFSAAAICLVVWVSVRND